MLDHVKGSVGEPKKNRAKGSRAENTTAMNDDE